MQGTWCSGGGGPPPTPRLTPRPSIDVPIAPSSMSRYSMVGEGRCLDKNSEPFDNIGGFGLWNVNASLSSKKIACEEFCQKVQSQPGHVGLAVNIPSERCGETSEVADYSAKIVLTLLHAQPVYSKMACYPHGDSLTTSSVQINISIFGTTRVKAK